MIIEFKNPMDKYGPMRTDEWYRKHVENYTLGKVYAPLYGVGTYDSKVWFPYELDTDCAPIDGLYATFDSEEKAIECIKRMGAVYAEDYDALCEKLKLRWYADDEAQVVPQA